MQNNQRGFIIVVDQNSTQKRNRMFESTAIQYATDSLTLMLTPTHILAGKQQTEKEILQIRTFRILNTLEKDSASLDPESQALLRTKIDALRSFFNMASKDVDPSRNFGLIANTIDKMICKKTIESLKDGGQALTAKEKLRNEQIRDQILKATEEKVRKISPEAFREFEKFINMLTDPCQDNRSLHFG
jgi:hypothetical protein